jgi:hypothetical protein
MTVLTLRPTGAGDVTQTTPYPNTGEANWQDVDEAAQDSDTTYVTAADPAKYDLYALANHTTETGVINFVKVCVYVKVVPAGDMVSDVFTKIKTGGTEYASTDLGESTGYALYSKSYTLNPQTGVAWTWDDIDALQAGVYLYCSNGEFRCTQVYVEVDYNVAPTVTTQAADAVAATTCTGNGNITATGGNNATRRGFCYKVGTSGDPTTADSVAYDDGSFGTGAYTKAMTGLSTGTSYRVRAYAVNSAGTSYGDTVQILTLPAAPTAVAATRGDHTDKSTVTWTKSTGATGYRVYRGAVDASGLLGDVATFDDTGADAPVITPGAAVATDGKFAAHVRLTLSGDSVAVGTTHTYKVHAVNDGGDSADSNTDTGWRSYGALTYQWQRSAADTDASYSNISGAIHAAYNDTGAPAYPDGGRYYKCVMNATGAAAATSTADHGYRKNPLQPGNVPAIIIKNPDGETLAYAQFASAINPDYRINELGSFKFSLPADSAARAHLVYPNEAWLYVDGELKDIFKILRIEKTR